MNQTSTRAGIMVHNVNGYEAFVPAKLPPVPPIDINPVMLNLLSQADSKLGRLDGITETLPNPELFVAMYVKKEAVLSAQIEGTQASLIDVLNRQAEAEHNEYTRDGVREVFNYVNAIYWGLSKLDQLPLSLRLIRNIHEVLLQDVRGANKNPGEFRRSQNWIGPMGCTLETATFVPPAVDDMGDAMSDLEHFMHNEEEFLPPLIKIALIHAQFETIHPFLDGNGRMGRLLITFWLCQKKILSQPLLYLSYYFKQNRQEYYDKLMAIREDGDWEGWIRFFLSGIAMVADEATNAAKEIISLQRKYSALLDKHRPNGYYQHFLNYLFENPIISRKDIMNELNISSPAAGGLLDTFIELSILKDLTPEKQRYKSYVFEEYFRILQKGTELSAQE